MSDIRLIPINDHEGKLINQAADSLFTLSRLTGRDDHKEQADAVGRLTSKLRFTSPVRMLDEEPVSLVA